MATGLRMTVEQFEALQRRNGARPAMSCVVHPDIAPPPAPVKPQDRMLALGRLEQGKMNNTEAAYAQYLETLKQAGEITWYAFEPMKLRLGKKTFYEPDFLVQLASGFLEVHEVKGYWKEDARVKIKTAAYLHPIYTFIAVTKRRKKDGGGWVREEF